MPLYEYFCLNCDNEVEVMKKIKDIEEEVHCVQCGEPMNRRCANSGGFRLEGNCWARDGYSSLYGDARAYEAKG